MPHRLQRFRFMFRDEHGKLRIRAFEAMNLAALMAGLFDAGYHPANWVAIRGE